MPHAGQRGAALSPALRPCPASASKSSDVPPEIRLQNKAASPLRPSPPLAHLQTHASAIDPHVPPTAQAPAAAAIRPELTSSSSSRDSLPALGPAADVRRGDTTPQKQGKTSRRAKSHKPNKWSKSGAGSSDSTGSERKPQQPHASKYSSPSSASSPQSTRSLNRNQSHAQQAAALAAAHQGRLMATAFGGPASDSRRGVGSPRPKGRGMLGSQCNVVVFSDLDFLRSQKYLLSQCHHLRPLPVRE